MKKILLLILVMFSSTTFVSAINEETSNQVQGELKRVRINGDTLYCDVNNFCVTIEDWRRYYNNNEKNVRYQIIYDNDINNSEFSAVEEPTPSVLGLSKYNVEKKKRFGKKKQESL